MKSVSLKIYDAVFGETEKIIKKLKVPRNRYINEALEYYNRHQRRLMLEKKLKGESKRTRKESISVLKDFEDIDYGS